MCDPRPGPVVRPLRDPDRRPWYGSAGLVLLLRPLRPKTGRSRHPRSRLDPSRLPPTGFQPPAAQADRWPPPGPAVQSGTSPRDEGMEQEIWTTEIQAQVPESTVMYWDCPFCGCTHRSAHVNELEVAVMACRDTVAPKNRGSLEAWDERETFLSGWMWKPTPPARGGPRRGHSRRATPSHSAAATAPPALAGRGRKEAPSSEEEHRRVSGGSNQQLMMGGLSRQPSSGGCLSFSAMRWPLARGCSTHPRKAA